MDEQIREALLGLHAMMDHLDRNNQRFWRDTVVLRQRVVDLESIVQFYRQGKTEIDLLQY